MDGNAVDQEFEKIAVNEQVRVMDLNLGYASTSSGLDASSVTVFDKFLEPKGEPLPDIDTDYVDPWRDLPKGSRERRR